MNASLEKLRKFIKLEIERGYDNRAVVGGLDKILTSWEAEAHNLRVPEDIIQQVKTTLAEYAQYSIKQRGAALQSLLQKITLLNVEESTQNPTAQPGVKQTPPTPPALRHVEAEKPQPLTAAKPAAQPAQQPARPATGSTSVGLNAPLTVLSGVGARHAETFRHLGVNTLGDLLFYFPRRYDDYSKLKPINRLQYNEEVTVIATVMSSSTRSVRDGRVKITEIVISDDTGYLRLTWFNQPWVASRLKSGDQVVVSGRIDMYLGRLVMNNPECEPLDQEHLHTNRIVPVYPLSSNITQRWLRRQMHQTVSFWAPRVPDFLPASTRQAAGLPDLPTALLQVHFPDSTEKLDAARERLAFDEIFLLQLGVLRQKRTWQQARARTFPITDEWLQEQISRLPFELTAAQQRAIQDVRHDLSLGQPMNRLLQGDVGSGKTVIAALAAAAITSQGAQAAFMAPTSILAEQHYRSLLGLLTPEGDRPNPPLQAGEIRLLLGDTPEAEKREIRNGLADGSIKLIIGTHALIESPVEFSCLQLAIIDEQHRFGVAQRSTLRSKGENPHLLVMTATPIPRSLALTIYGDLDLSVMDEMPPGRQPVETLLIPPVERENAYQMVRNQVEKGHQAFIICPLVEKGENDDSKAAVEEHARLQKEVFPELKLGLLHGRLKPEEKDRVMTAFREKEYQVIVSTSVVEVGVDIPNATIMLVEGANRFGLAQLHQFRGRVGRGADHSFCLLIPETEDALENERLMVMTQTNDGFVLAEHDLNQRGPGDFLGTRQAGFADLRMASLTDVRLIEKARKHAQEIFERDPDLSTPENIELEKMVNRFWLGGRGDIS